MNAFHGRPLHAGDYLKLKQARKEYKRRYERGETKHGDKHKEWVREKYRIANGIALDAPVNYTKRETQTS